MNHTLSFRRMAAAGSAALVAGCAGLSVPLLPGNSVASPVVQRNTLKAVRVVAGSEECPDPKVTDTQVLKYPARSGKPWEERWIIDRCGEPVSLHMWFTPDHHGSARVSVAEEKAAPAP